jgi:hypothetical protein
MSRKNGYGNGLPRLPPEKGRQFMQGLGGNSGFFRLILNWSLGSAIIQNKG